MRENQETSITFRLSERDKEQLQAIAKEKDLSLSQLVRMAVKEYLKANTKGEVDVSIDVTRFIEFAERHNKEITQ